MQRNTKSYTILLCLLSLLLAAMLAVLIFRFDPYQGWLILVVFYLLFLGLCFVLTTLAGFWARRFFGKREYLNDHLKISARQGLWLGILLTLLLLLKSAGLFNLISVFLLLIALIFLESYFIYAR
ncbi:MAG: hypothetical protein HY545_00500 [Candidatus Doudnabacteria bacterium]|nr:hypothetical protein [Candidatus Doudnabacteria bacterium]